MCGCFINLFLTLCPQVSHFEDHPATSIPAWLAVPYKPHISVLNPPLSLQSEFDKTVAPLWSKIHENQNQVQTLATLRDTPLLRLISGQLRLPEAEAALEEA